MGAGRARLVRQLCTEFSVLAIAGTAGGLAVAQVAMRGLGLYDLPGGIPIASLELALDHGCCCLRLGSRSSPGCSVCSRRVGSTTVAAARSTSTRIAGTETAGQARSQAVLLASQVAVSVVLLCGSGLFIRSLQAGLAMETGLDSRHGRDRVGESAAWPVLARADPGLRRYRNGAARSDAGHQFGRSDHGQAGVDRWFRVLRHDRRVRGSAGRGNQTRGERRQPRLLPDARHRHPGRSSAPGLRPRRRAAGGGH